MDQLRLPLRLLKSQHGKSSQRLKVKRIWGRYLKPSCKLAAVHVRLQLRFGADATWLYRGGLLPVFSSFLFQCMVFFFAGRNCIVKDFEIFLLEIVFVMFSIVLICWIN